MLRGFKEFILKGNVIDLATAVVVGSAFTAIVTAFTKGVIQPVINTIPFSPDAAKGLGFEIISDRPSTFVNLGGVVTAAINFLMIAAVIYFVIIMPYNKLAELGGFGKKSEVTSVALLTEIRDLLDPEGTSAAKEQATEELPDHLTPKGSGRRRLLGHRRSRPAPDDSGPSAGPQDVRNPDQGRHSR